MADIPDDEWPEFPAQFETEAYSDFASLSEQHQRCLDDAIGELEWMPHPIDAAVVEGGVLSVERCGYEIVYSVEGGHLVIWGFEEA